MDEIRQDVIVTVDVVVFSLDFNGALKVLLPPRQDTDGSLFPGVPALPGVFVKPADRTADESARRALKVKAGLTLPYLEQLYTFSGPARDPRSWSISVAYYALVPWSALGPAEEHMVVADHVPRLPFDHNEIIQVALTRLRSKSAYSPLLFHLMPDTFTISDILDVYRKVTGEDISRTTFRQRILEAGYLQPTGENRVEGAHRPAALYRLAMHQKMRNGLVSQKEKTH